MYFLVSVLSFAAVTLAFLLVERAARAPSRPRWLDSDTGGMLVSVAFTGAFAGSLGVVLSSALSLPMPIWGDVASAIVVILAAAVAVRYLVRLVSPRKLAH